MNKALPKVTESVETLRQKLKSESHPKKLARLQALYLLASNQAHSRKQLSQLLAVHRHTVAEWLNLYGQHGLDKLLALDNYQGRVCALSSEAQAALQSRLQDPQGFASYREIHQLVVEKYQVNLTYSAVHALVRYKWQAKPKSPRPSNPKKT